MGPLEVGLRPDLISGIPSRRQRHFGCECLASFPTGDRVRDPPGRDFA